MHHIHTTPHHTWIHPLNQTRYLGTLWDFSFQVGPWLTHQCKFSEFEASFDEWLKPETGVIKALVEVSAD